MSVLTVPMNNGVKSYVCQLKRLTVLYSYRGGSSKGARQYIDERVVDFAKNNPSVAVYVRTRLKRDPRIVAEFLNGRSQVIPIPNLTVDEIEEFVCRMRTSSGNKPTKLRKYWHTHTPSIQGNWSPFLMHSNRHSSE